MLLILFTKAFCLISIKYSNFSETVATEKNCPVLNNKNCHFSLVYFLNLMCKNSVLKYLSYFNNLKNPEVFHNRSICLL